MILLAFVYDKWEGLEKLVPAVAVTDEGCVVFWRDAGVLEIYRIQAAQDDVVQEYHYAVCFRRRGRWLLSLGACISRCILHCCEDYVYCPNLRWFREVDYTVGPP